MGHDVFALQTTVNRLIFQIIPVHSGIGYPLIYPIHLAQPPWVLIALICHALTPILPCCIVLYVRVGYVSTSCALPLFRSVTAVSIPPSVTSCATWFVFHILSFVFHIKPPPDH